MSTVLPVWSTPTAAVPAVQTMALAVGEVADVVMIWT